EAKASKRCPKCNWLDQEDVIECFRCGFNFETLPQHTEFFAKEKLKIPKTQIQIMDSYKQILKQKKYDSFLDYQLRLEAEKSNLISGFERLITLKDLDIAHYDYQLKTVQKALSKMRGTVLLADEVGLGKTIEAGIITKELIERKLVHRILVLVPASIVSQWQDELFVKFGENFIIPTKPKDWLEPKIVTSLDYAKSKVPSELILQQEFDLLIVDEAHRLKNRSTILFKFVNQIKKKYVLMLTATPVHNNLTELYSLVTILKPGLLGTIRNFKKNYVSSYDQRKPSNPAQLKRLLKEVMIRNRRDKTGIKLPKRRGAVYHLNFFPLEQQLYDQVTDFIQDELAKKSEQNDTFRMLALITLQRSLCSSPQAVRSTMIKMIAKEDGYSEFVKEKLSDFVSLCDKIKSVRKIKATIEIVKKFPGKYLIFTEYLQTMEVLKTSLEAEGYKVGRFFGGISSISAKRRALEKFEQEQDILICTQSGGEGLNLQFCSHLINYDLPWNPMKVEQRIGRIHRLGQKNEVSIFNLSITGTIEARVLELLVHKIRMFEMVIGELDLILGMFDEEKSFEKNILEIWVKSRSEREIEKRFKDFGEKIAGIRKEFINIKNLEAIVSDLASES
ncbi:DEAD/DEAH box helicase, partial [bacterium]|nr:DEAD/DEAH box helicase [bacterium]